MVNIDTKVQDMDKIISEMSKLVDGLYEKADGNQGIVRNLDRISASLNILKISVSDMTYLV